VASMAGSGADARRWREWLRGVLDSLGRLDGESGLEFCESAALIVRQELKENQPVAETIADLMVVGTVAALVVGDCVGSHPSWHNLVSVATRLLNFSCLSRFPCNDCCRRAFLRSSP
jgi:hypothetical protein